jgi:hypothetical protein
VKGKKKMRRKRQKRSLTKTTKKTHNIVLAQLPANRVLGGLTGEPPLGSVHEKEVQGFVCVPRVLDQKV